MPQVMKDRSLGAVELAYIIDGAQDDVGHTSFMFLGGFKSDMTGKKAEALGDLARSTRRQTLRFDYSGHGQSSGAFTEGTISAWLEQTMHMFLAHTKSKVIVIGSSMGGWLAQLLVARLKVEDPLAYRRIAGLVLLAPATDMTKVLMWDRYDVRARAALNRDGIYLEPSAYGEAYEITAELVTDGEKHLLLEKGLDVPFPTRILQGSNDHEVPPSHALSTFDSLRGGDVTLTFIKGGDHRLSTPGNLRLMCDTVLRLAERADGA